MLSDATEWLGHNIGGIGRAVPGCPTSWHKGMYLPGRPHAEPLPRRAPYSDRHVALGGDIAAIRSTRSLRRQRLSGYSSAAIPDCPIAGLWRSKGKQRISC